MASAFVDNETIKVTSGDQIGIFFIQNTHILHQKNPQIKIPTWSPEVILIIWLSTNVDTI